MSNPSTEQAVNATYLKIIAHELKSPMQTMMSTTDIIEMLVGDDYAGDRAEMAKVLSRMRNAIEMMRVQLNDLATYANATDTSLLVQSVPFDPSETLRQIENSFQPFAAAKSIGLSVVGLEDAIWVKGDQSRLTQIMRNLTDNAIKYSEKGQIVIRLSSGGNTVMMEVVDDGIGIHQDDLPSMHLPFRRGSNVPKKSEGSGLGLSIVDNLTRQMGGTLSITQRPEGGTIARVSLPQHQP